MRIRLTRKFADLMDGIDLSRRKAGDIVELSERDAAILLAEGWAEAAPPAHLPRTPQRRIANDSAPRAKRKKR